MSLLRRAIGRKEVLLAIAFCLLAGGLVGWRLLGRAATAQVAGTDALLPVRDLLDAGQYAEAAAQVDSLAASVEPGRLLGYKALAQFLANQPAAALPTAETALAAGSTTPDTAVAAGVKALVLLTPEQLDVPQARQAAEQALQAAGDDPEALLLARVAVAAALRSELDGSGQVADASAHLARMRQVLTPLYESSAEPPSAWQKHLWRRGLAVLADAGFLAADRGDAAGEPAALALLQRCCPQDAWDCYFHIPAKALAAARAGTLDDHSRVAMLTASGFLYLQSGDRLHGDALFRRAILAYGRLLEDYNDWQGKPHRIVTPKGVPKVVGSEEFHDYRNRMERLAKYSADWWGIRVVRNEVDLPTALKACDHKLYRAIVRVRADRQANPIRVLFDERIRHVDFLTVADWFHGRPYAPQADWEKARADLLKKVGQEEYAAFQTYQRVRALIHEGKTEDAVIAMADGLASEPTLAETGVDLRCEMANQLTLLNRPDEALLVLEAAQARMDEGDPYLGQDARFLRGRILTLRTAALQAKGDLLGATQQAAQIARDESIASGLRMLALARLTSLNVRLGRNDAAKAAYDRLAAFPEPRPALLAYAGKCLAASPATAPAQAGAVAAEPAGQQLVTQGTGTH